MTTPSKALKSVKEDVQNIHDAAKRIDNLEIRAISLYVLSLLPIIEGAIVPELPEGAINNLKNHQQQLDGDGCFVGVSRQALDEVLAAIEKVKP